MKMIEIHPRYKVTQERKSNARDAIKTTIATTVFCLGFLLFCSWLDKMDAQSAQANTCIGEIKDFSGKVAEVSVD